MKAAAILFRRLLVGFGFIQKPDFLFSLVEEHPIDTEIQRGIIYVVGGNNYKKWAYFRCPSDQTEIIQLSLMENHRPRWRIQWDWLERPTIFPSVRQNAGSFAHFWVRRGNVIFCADSGEPMKRP